MQIKKWQLKIALWGSVTWAVSFPLLNMANSLEVAFLSRSIVGYIIGFMTAFSGFLAWAIFDGRWKQLFGDNTVIGNILLAVPLIILFLFGTFGTLNEIFNSNPWYYNITFAVAMVVVHRAVLPTMEYLHSRQRSKNNLA